MKKLAVKASLSWPSFKQICTPEWLQNCITKITIGELHKQSNRRQVGLEGTVMETQGPYPVPCYQHSVRNSKNRKGWLAKKVGRGLHLALGKKRLTNKKTFLSQEKSRMKYKP